MNPVLLGEIMSGAMFAVTFIALLLGFPVAFTLAGVSIAFAAIGSELGIFTWPLLSGVGNRIYGIMINEILVAVPLFVFMGVMLERSRIAEQLLTTMGELFGTMRGGLGISVVIVGALLAASTGIVGAVVVTMGLISLPTMLKAGYDKRLASGAICASGTLAQIIPPSTVLILLSDQLQGAYMQANMAMGKFAFDPVSVTELFAGALLPGLLLVGLYIVGILFFAWLRPSSCPALPMDEDRRRDLPRRVLKIMMPPLTLIILVLGSIFAGIATATESAAIGAVGATVLAAMQRALTFEVLRAVCRATLAISTMIFVILIGATIFSLVFRGLGGEALVEELLTSIPGGLYGAMLLVLGIMFVLGFFIDTFEIIFIVVPLFSPALFLLGADPILLGVLMGMVLQTSYLTPPFGFAIFYLQGVSRALNTTTIYAGVTPFLALQVLGIVAVLVFPALAMWLPAVIG